MLPLIRSQTLLRKQAEGSGLIPNQCVIAERGEIPRGYSAEIYCRQRQGFPISIKLNLRQCMYQKLKYSC